MTASATSTIVPILVFVVLPVLLWILYMGAQAFRHWYQPKQYERQLLRSTQNSSADSSKKSSNNSSSPNNYSSSKNSSGSERTSPISTITGGGSFKGHKVAAKGATMRKIKSDVFVPIPIYKTENYAYGDGIFVWADDVDPELGSNRSNWVLSSGRQEKLHTPNNTPIGTPRKLSSAASHICKL